VEAQQLAPQVRQILVMVVVVEMEQMLVPQAVRELLLYATDTIK
jgi:hypothetical protein